MSAEYLAGRKLSELPALTGSYTDSLYAAERCEGSTLTAFEFDHCTFANVSFKGSTLERCKFNNVAFVGVYFRDTELQSCQFEGCKFIDCDMTRVDIRSSDFRWYNTFVRTFVPFDRIVASLPEKEGNRREDMCNNLSAEATAAGKFDDAGKFRAAAMQGRFTDKWATMLRRDPFYKNKYAPADQALAAVELAQMLLFNALWGTTRSHWVVLRNWMIFGLLAFCAFALVGAGAVGAPNWFLAGLYGAVSTVPVNPPTDYTLTGWGVHLLLFVTRALGLVFAAVFGALVYARAYGGRR